MFTIQHGETVQRIRWLRDERNAHGKVTPVFSDPEPIENVGVDAPRADEPRDGTSNRQIVELVLFLPAGTVVDVRDQFIVRGKTYGVEGESPALANFFTGTPFLTEVKLRKVTG